MNNVDARDVLVSSKRLRARYGVTDRTIHRWENDLRMGFPQPLRIRGRKYWRLEELESYEQVRAAARRP